jgi:acyl-coenzyme A thioesterase 13
MASLALTTSGLPPPTGVSTNIQTEFLRPAGKEGGEFVIEAEVVKLGMCGTQLDGLQSDLYIWPLHR